MHQGRKDVTIARGQAVNIVTVEAFALQAVVEKVLVDLQMAGVGGVYYLDLADCVPKTLGGQLFLHVGFATDNQRLAEPGPAVGDRSAQNAGIIPLSKTQSVPCSAGAGGAKVACRETVVRQGAAPDIPAAAGSEKNVPARPEPKSAPRERPAHVIPRRAGQSHAASYVLGGIGVTGLTVGLVTGGMALGEKNTVDSECDAASRTCTQEGLDAAKSGRTLSTVSNVSFGVGIIALGAAIYLMLDSDEAPNVSLLRGPGPQGRASRFNARRGCRRGQ